MRVTVSLGCALALSICAGETAAQATKTIAERSAPLVREFEALYRASMQAARRGDLEGYWALRTTASQTRPPVLDRTRLQLLADLLPPLERMDFVRLDASGTAARTLYKWRGSDAAQYSIILYRQEHGRWRIDEVSVRRNGSSAPSPRSSTSPRIAPPPAGSATGTDIERRAQELLQPWESGGADASRSLSPPRL